MTPRRTLLVAVLVAALVIALIIGNANDTTPANSGAQSSATLSPRTPGDAAWFCPGFPRALRAADTSITISNIGDVPADVVVTVLADTGNGGSRTFRVDGRSVTTHPRPELGPEGALTVESFGGHIVVEEGIDGEAGVEVAPCATRAAAEWQFAAGTTPRGVEEWLVVQNPFASDAKVDITLRTSSGVRKPELLQSYDVRRRSRAVLPIHGYAVRERRVAVEVQATTGQVVAAQTIVYTEAAAPRGVAMTIGTPAPSEQWYFAEGAAATGTTSWVAVANTQTVDATVDVHVTADDEELVPQLSLTVAQDDVVWIRLGGCAARATGDCVPIPASTRYALGLRAEGVPIVAQVFTRFGADAPDSGVAAPLGTTQPARRWAFARDRVASEVTTSLALVNPLAQAAEVDISQVHDGRVDEPKRHVVPPGGRVRVQTATAATARRPVRALVVDASSPVYAERIIVAGNGVGIAPGVAIG
jgi:hypothetical protein